MKIGICDDNNNFRESLEQFINDTQGFEVIISTSNGDDMLALLDLEVPDAILMDIDMPTMTGIETTRNIKKKFPAIHILMLTVYEDEEKIFEAILAGASGYILKKSAPEKIIDAFKEVQEGGASMSPLIVRKVLNHFNSQQPIYQEYDLSGQEKKVLQCLVDGHSYKMIAANCNISMGTVRFHINNIYKKLHINSKSEAVAKAINESILSRK